MSFMYLKLRATNDGIEAEVVPDGELKFRSLGTENSRWTTHPHAVFQIEKFTGLSAIATEDIENELVRRLGREEVRNRLKDTLTTDELFDILRGRTE